MNTKNIIIILLLFVGSNIFANKTLKDAYGRSVRKKAVCCDWGNLFNQTMRDLVDINKEVFTSTDTLKIMTGVLPTYLIARSNDKVIHECFYEPGLHKNVSQLPKFFHELSNKGVTIAIIGLSALPFISEVSEDVRDTSKLMLKGVLSVSSMRTIIKYSLKSRVALRPWSEKFSNTCRSIGGFPSGHMANVTYLSMLYGLRHGASWGFPLSILSAITFFGSINVNRHYASQLIGGMGIGLAYGYASYKVLENRFGSNLNVSLDTNSSGYPRVSATYEF